MIPGMGMNPKQMAQAMKAMGIKQREIGAERVVIETGDGNIIVSSPKVVEIEMQGVKTFQVMGEIREERGVSEGDVKMVAEQAGVGEEAAKEALEKAGGDIAQAILDLSG